MFVVANIVKAVIFVFESIISVYSFVVIAACLLSFVNPDPYNPIVRIIRNLTEPVFWRIRKYLPFVVVGGLDLSPLVLLLGIHVIKIVVFDSLFHMLALMM